ncbi:MAG: PEP-CTERM sorting domain-containing protein [Verrucomicrobiaceae bacterium]
MKITIGLLAASTLLCHSAVLLGSGDHLPDPGNHLATSPGVIFTIASSPGTFTGTWTTPAASPWIGTATATGIAPNNGSNGLASIDFTSLAAGYLPAGTMLLFSDVDTGASESITIEAFDAGGSNIGAWLDEPTATWGSGTGGGGSIAPDDMPSWIYDTIDLTYEIHGGGIGTSSPTIGVVMLTNQNIYTMDIDKNHSFNGLYFRAPESVPEPSSILLGSLAAGLLILRRQRA